MRKLSALHLLPLFVLFLAGCSSSALRDAAPSEPVDVSDIPDAEPRIEPRSRYGNPEEYVVFGQRYRVMEDSKGFRQRGIASWYGTKFHGRRTSSGEPYDMYQMTAAHKSLPLPTYVRVTHLDNGKSIVVRVNDRGPFHDGRIIDLSYVAAKKLGIDTTGTGPVEIVAIDPAADTIASAVPEPEAVQAEPIATESLETPVNDSAAGLAMTASGAADMKEEFFIQLGAFGERRNAETLSHELAAAGFVPVGIEPDGQLHRVRLGPLATREAAEEVTVQLIAQGIESFRIISQSRR